MIQFESYTGASIPPKDVEAVLPIRNKKRHVQPFLKKTSDFLVSYQMLHNTEKCKSYNCIFKWKKKVRILFWVEYYLFQLQEQLSLILAYLILIFNSTNTPTVY